MTREKAGGKSVIQVRGSHGNDGSSHGGLQPGRQRHSWHSSSCRSRRRSRVTVGAIGGRRDDVVQIQSR